MALKGVVSGTRKLPDRILIYGVEGIGKTSFAAGFPKPIFLETDKAGTARLNVDRIQIDSWEELNNTVKDLRKEDHEYKTLVIDTLDAAEQQCWQYCCTRDGQKAIDVNKGDYSYGKGFVAAMGEWRVLISELESTWSIREMNVILICHANIKTFKNPEGGDYDRFQLKLHDKPASYIKEWCDENLFAKYETFAKEDHSGRAKGVGTGNRILHTAWNVAFDAKNRYGLPDTIPLSYAAFQASKKDQVDPNKIKNQIIASLEAINDRELDVKVFAAVAEAGNDVVKLTAINSRLEQLKQGEKNVAA